MVVGKWEGVEIGHCNNKGGKQVVEDLDSARLVGEWLKGVIGQFRNELKDRQEDHDFVLFVYLDTALSGALLWVSGWLVWYHVGCFVDPNRKDSYQSLWALLYHSSRKYDVRNTIYTNAALH